METFICAKNIFEKYRGSYFHMERDGVLKEYKSYKIPREIEEMWLKEKEILIKQELLDCTNYKLISEHMELLGHYVVELKDLKELDFMIDYIVKRSFDWDSNTVIRCVNACLSAMNISKGVRRRNIKDICVNILKESIDRGIFISDDYRENGTLPDYLSRDRLENNIKRAIQYWSIYCD